MKNSFFLLLFFCVLESFAQCKSTAKSAAEHIGEYCEITGTIVTTYQPKWTDRPCPIFLNFEQNYPNQVLTVTIWEEDIRNFSNNPLIYYKGKTVIVKGKIREYRGKPQIVLKGDIEIIILDDKKKLH